jgi:hypothetical protein
MEWRVVLLTALKFHQLEKLHPVGLSDFNACIGIMHGEREFKSILESLDAVLGDLNVVRKTLCVVIINDSRDQRTWARHRSIPTGSH